MIRPAEQELTMQSQLLVGVAKEPKTSTLSETLGEQTMVTRATSRLPPCQEKVSVASRKEDLSGPQLTDENDLV
jgi:hypothetical protein